MIVMPSELYTAAGAVSGIEGELQFRQVISTMIAKTGQRLANRLTSIASIPAPYARSAVSCPKTNCAVWPRTKTNAILKARLPRFYAAR